MCQDDGCGRLVTEDELLRCKGPGCGGIVCFSNVSTVCDSFYLANYFVCSFILHVGGSQRNQGRTGTVMMIVK